MKIDDLYRYRNTNGSVSITTEQRKMTDIPYKKRLIADEGFYLKKGEEVTTAIDVKIEEIDEWTEIERETNKYEQIIDILTGGEG